MTFWARTAPQAVLLAAMGLIMVATAWLPQIPPPLLNVGVTGMPFYDKPELGWIEVMAGMAFGAVLTWDRWAVFPG